MQEKEGNGVQFDLLLQHTQGMQLHRADAVASPVYAAALHAAVRCGRYQEGAKVFELCQKRCKIIDAPVYTQALQIFGKLNEHAKVEDLWVESLEKCQLDIVLASARLAAAADLGNITGAAQILDMVNESALVVVSEFFTLHFSRQWCQLTKMFQSVMFFGFLESTKSK